MSNYYKLHPQLLEELQNIFCKPNQTFTTDEIKSLMFEQNFSESIYAYINYDVSIEEFNNNKQFSTLSKVNESSHTPNLNLIRLVQYIMEMKIKYNSQIYTLDKKITELEKKLEKLESVINKK